MRPTDDEWLDIEPVISITGLARGTIYNRISKGGDVPVAYKFGQQLRFRRSDLDAWLEAHRRVPASTQLAENSPHRT
jgi:excisionase family DNA binding protein